MEDSFFKSWFVLLPAVSLIVMCVPFYGMYRQHQQNKQSKKVKEKTLFGKDLFQEATPNGWVRVKESALHCDVQERSAKFNIDALPDWTARMLAGLTDMDRYNILLWHKTNPTNTQEWIEMRRGLTIGSALFNYSIPESFVLIDDKTQFWYARFCSISLARYNYTTWNQRIDFRAVNFIVNEIEKKESETITLGGAQQFFIQYNEFIACELLRVSNQKFYPSIEAFTTGAMMALKLGVDNFTPTHYLRLTLTTIIRLTEVEVPLNWIMNSDLGDALMSYLHSPEKTNTEVIDPKPIPPALKLVVDNVKLGKKEHVW